MNCNCNIQKFRIGKDIGIKWNLTTAEGETLPEIITQLSFEMIDPKGNHYPIEEFEVISDNDIEFGLTGTMFKYLGRYHLTAWRNKGEIGQTMVDSLDAFELVRWTPEEENNCYGRR